MTGLQLASANGAPAELAAAGPAAIEGIPKITLGGGRVAHVCKAYSLLSRHGQACLHPLQTLRLHVLCLRSWLCSGRAATV